MYRFAIPISILLFLIVGSSVAHGSNKESARGGFLNMMPVADNYNASATENNGTCDYCSCGGGGGGASVDFPLVVESSPAVGTGGTVYRFYVQMQDATDRFSSVFGNDQACLIINTPAGVFNSPYNSSWNASGINPAFLPRFPDLADDSFATIGLDGPASSSGLAGAADPSIVEDASLSPTVSGYFTSGGTGLKVNTLKGAAWYVLNTAANGLPDANMRVLIAQVTTAGDISGQMNYQVFPLGVGADQQQISIEFNGTGTFGGVVGGNACGFTDATATNYDASAQYDGDRNNQSIGENVADSTPTARPNETNASNRIRIRTTDKKVEIERVAVIGKQGELCSGAVDDGQGIAELVEGELLGLYDVVERRHLEDILQEQRLAMSGLIFEDSDFAKAGCLAGAQGTVLVSYSCLQDKTKLQIKLVDCSTSDLFWSATGIDVSEFDLLDALRRELSKR